eukprot:Tamp_09422.p1 GENE.Tamp_09422~~Tamp_09422.p1  ORF type:complete len:497 (+),score=80.83 Tamp_09422:164-1492(+)
MYTARTLLRKVDDVEIDVIDMLPTPFGLVRYGVAPDHVDTKNVINEFSQILSADNCAYHGNVTVGKDIDMQHLLDSFHAVVLAYGAEGDRKLGLPGETLNGSMSARDFVNWYNGHPHYAHLCPPLSSSKEAVIIGNGNVAIDVARLLIKPVDLLRQTDIAEHALEALASSSISRVHIVGRRGPVQSAFTIAELREVCRMQGCNVVFQPQELALDEEDTKQVSKRRGTKRIMALMEETCYSPRDPQVEKELHFRFLLSPNEIVGASTNSDRVGALKLEVNTLQGQGEQRTAVGSGNMTVIPCDLVMQSVGYRSVALQGVPFDNKTHTVPQAGGAVIAGGERVPGLYVAGWLKRGPSGIIGTNISDAQQTATSLIIDWEAGNLDSATNKEGRAGLTALLQSRQVRAVSAADWRKIDEAEVERGAEVGRPRCKFVSVADMLRVLD